MCLVYSLNAESVMARNSVFVTLQMVMGFKEGSLDLFWLWMMGNQAEVGDLTVG